MELGLTELSILGFPALGRRRLIFQATYLNLCGKHPICLSDREEDRKIIISYFAKNIFLDF